MSTLKVGEIKHENFTGTTQLKLDNSGNVGIGTSTPTSPDGSNADNSLNGPTLTIYGDSPAINLTSSTTGASDYSLINFGRTGSSSNPYRAVIGYKQSDDILRINAQNHIAFDAGGGINASEVMRIDGSGKVLIGTTTEGQANADNLTIDGGDAETGITIRSGTSRGNHIYFADGTSGADEYRGIISYQHSNNKMQFFTDATERMTIDSAGKVGIGTNSPTEILHIKEGTNKNLHFTGGIGQIGNVTGFFAVNDANDAIVDLGMMGDTLRFATGSAASGAERMRIDSSGHVGIGTTSPDDFDADCKDLVISRSGHAGITINSGSAGSTSNGNIAFAEGTAGSADKFRGGIQYTHGSDHMAFFTNAGERLRIDSSGNVGVSTTSPVTQTNTSGIALTPVLDLKGTGTNNNESGVLQFTRKDHVSDGSCIFNSGDDGGLTFRNTDGNGMAFYNGTTLALRVDSGGRMTSLGNKASSNAQSLQNTSSTNPEGLYIRFPNAAPNTVSRHFLHASDSSTTRMVIDSNGNLRNENNSYGGFSDVSLKDNIVDASSQWNDIKNVKVRVFNFKTDDASKKRIGVVAQEIETVCPKLVDEVFDKDSNGNLLETSKKSVKYSVLYMKAIKALQEAMSKIEVLETKVAALEAA